MYFYHFIYCIYLFPLFRELISWHSEWIYDFLSINRMCFGRRFVLSDKRKKICDSVWTVVLYIIIIKKKLAALAAWRTFCQKRIVIFKYLLWYMIYICFIKFMLFIIYIYICWQYKLFLLLYFILRPFDNWLADCCLALREQYFSYLYIYDNNKLNNTTWCQLYCFLWSNIRDNSYFDWKTLWPKNGRNKYLIVMLIGKTQICNRKRWNVSFDHWKCYKASVKRVKI